MKNLKKYIKTFLTIIKKPEMSVLPGQLAFFVVLSVVPIVTLIGYGASLFNVSLTLINDFFQKAFGSEIVELITPMVVTGSKIDIQFIVLLVVAFIIASNGARSIIIAANSIYGLRSDNAVKRRVKSITMTLIIVLLVIFILIVPLFGNKIVDLILYLDIKEKLAIRIIWILKILRGPISWFIMLVVIKIIYTMAPDKRIPSANVNYGALFTTIGWAVATSTYSYYITHYSANYKLIYSGLSNLVILMLWLYILTTIFVWGMAINSNTEHEIELAKNVGINKKDM